MTECLKLEDTKEAFNIKSEAFQKQGRSLKITDIAYKSGCFAIVLE